MEEVYILDDELNGKPVRIYAHGDTIQSICYTEEKDRFKLVSSYMKKWNDIFVLNGDVKDILLIGGGGFSYPKYILSHHDDVCIDVVDYDENAYDIAKKYFFLDEAINKYDPNEERLTSIVQEGRLFLESNDKKYDVVISDAYNGYSPVLSLHSLEAIQLIKETLNKDGIYCANVTAFDFESDNSYIKRVMHTVNQVFKHVVLTKQRKKNNDNYVLFASDRNYEYTQVIKVKYQDATSISDDNLDEVVKLFEEELKKQL